MDKPTLQVVLVKVGGSSITNKETKESLNEESLEWFSQTLSAAIGLRFQAPHSNQCERPNESRAFILIHGAGSFGHFSAKAYGLQGQAREPDSANGFELDDEERRWKMKGLSETRLSVQKLNHLVVSSLVSHGINAVGLSPCFGVPQLHAHGGNLLGATDALEATVRDTIYAGLVAVLHGDACLYGNGAGILSGDTLMKILGKSNLVSEVIFITDVDGVFTEDPRENPSAKLLRYISVDRMTGEITTDLTASGSSHDHDVTGGLKVRGEAKYGVERCTSQIKRPSRYVHRPKSRQQRQ